MIRGEIEKKDFREQKHKHERLCKIKEEEEKKREQMQLIEIKDRNDVLKYIKKEKQAKGGVNEEISEDEWVRHFMQLLDREETMKTTEEENKEAKEKENEEVVVRLLVTEEEIERAINRLKKNKAAGEDGIRNEAWMNVDKETKKRLRQIIQKVSDGEQILEG